MAGSTRSRVRGDRRWGRGQRSDRKDPYRPVGKLAEPVVCPDCGAVYLKGRWQWAIAPEGAEQTRCEACHRIHDAFPAGTLTIRAALTDTEAQEVMALARHQEEAEKKDHPLNRIMAVDRPRPDEIVITTTDLHLPHRIARAIERAHGGHTSAKFEKDGDTVRVEWRKD